MLTSLSAMTLAGVASSLSLAKLRRTAKALAVDPLELADLIGRTANRERLEALAGALREEGAFWEAGLLDGILHPLGRARVAAVNEQLDELSLDLDAGQEIAVGAARISGLGAMCIICASIAAGSASAGAVLEVLTWGAAGIFVSISAGREAKRVATSLRRGVDTLVERALSAATRTNDSAPADRGGVDPDPMGV